MNATTGQPLPTKKITLIAGRNGSGKTRVIERIAAAAEPTSRVRRIPMRREYQTWDAGAPIGAAAMIHPRADDRGFGQNYLLWMKEIMPVETAAAAFANPVVCELLRAKPGDLVAIEHPELGLHPDGQKGLTKMLVSAANAGIQIVLETHSGAIFNSLRIEVYDGHLQPEDFKIYWLEESGETIEPKCDRNGRIDRRPEGFFTYHDEACYHLLIPAKKKGEK